MESLIDSVFSFEEKYAILHILGTGEFGKVYKIADTTTGEIFAAKKIKKKKCLKDKLPREIEALRSVDHPNIVKLFNVLDDRRGANGSVYLILEYVSGGELYDWILKPENRIDKQIIRIVKQLVSAIKYLHDHNMIHRDLKPENILCEFDAANMPTVKLSDFGLARILADDAACVDKSKSTRYTLKHATTICGSPEYIAPEIALGQPYDFAVDMWSLGVVTFVLLTGSMPFFAENLIALFRQIANAEYDWLDDAGEVIVDKKAKRFVKKLLNPDPRARMTAAKAELHPWLASSEEKKARKSEAKDGKEEERKEPVAKVARSRSTTEKRHKKTLTILSIFKNKSSKKRGDSFSVPRPKVSRRKRPMSLDLPKGT